VRARTLIVVAIVGAVAFFAWTKWKDRKDSDESSDRRGGGGNGTSETKSGKEHLVSNFAGKQVEIELLGAPSAVYAGRGDDDQADRTYRAMVSGAAGPSVIYDRDLSRAAREVAYQIALHGTAPPEAAMTFILHSSGAAELSAAQFFTHTTSDKEDVLRDTIARALAEPPSGLGPIRIGVGEASTPDQKYTRHISVLVTRRNYDIDPASRTAELGSEWTLRGRLPEGFKNQSASVLLPNSTIVEAELHVDGRDFRLVAPTGDDVGTMYVGIDGTGARGPGKLLQLSVEVGREPPRSTTVTVPISEEDFQEVEQAEQYSVGLVNADRAQFMLDSLELDPELSAVARKHSEDMRDAGFFGHRSPTTGLSGQRLERAEYRAYAHAENLARNDSLGEAQQSLMQSVGHRANILKPDWTHIGIGVARRDDGEWFVTQLFVKKVVEVAADSGAAALLDRINTKRGDAGFDSLDRDADLSAIAQRHAPSVAYGELEGITDVVGRDIKGHFRRQAAISVHVIYDFDGFQPPDAALDPDMTSIGIGVMQSESDMSGRIGVVLVVAR
jgi:uncharacterized protein YkwD